MTCIPNATRNIRKKSQDVNNSKRTPSFFESIHRDIILKLKRLIREYGRSNSIPKDRLEQLIKEVEDGRDRS